MVFIKIEKHEKYTSGYLTIVVFISRWSLYTTGHSAVVPLLRNTRERTQKFSASTVNAFDVSSHQRTPLIRTIIWQKPVSLLERDYCGSNNYI